MDTDDDDDSKQTEEHEETFTSNASSGNGIEISIDSSAAQNTKRHPISPMEVDIRSIPDVEGVEIRYLQQIPSQSPGIEPLSRQTTTVSTPVHKHGANHSDDDYISPQSTKRKNNNRSLSIDTKHYLQFKCHKFVLHAEIIGRILLMFLNLVLLTLSTGYCAAQWFRSSLDLVKPCNPIKTIEEIWKHSYKAGLVENNEVQMTPISQYGHTTEACWTTKKLDTDTDPLWYSNVYVPYDVEQPINVQTVAFGVLMMCCLCVTIYNIYTLIIDCVYATKRKLHTRSKMYRDFMKQNTANTSIQSPNIETKWRRFTRYLSALWSKYMTNDTTGWIIRCVIYEIVEITIQTQALLLYNGYNVLDPNHQNNIYLANQSHFIVIFATILAFNCFGSGLLWLLYALVTKYCHGLLFKLLLFWVDQLSDLLYTLYPFMLIIFDRNNDDAGNIRVLLSQLNTNTTFIAFISSFIPLVLLASKSLLISHSAQTELADKYYSHWKFIHDLSKQKDDQQIAYQAKLAGWSLNATQLQKNNKEMFGSKANLLLVMNKTITRTNWIQTQGKDQVSRKKQCFLTMVALAYIVYGVAVLLYVLNHVNQAEQYCDMVQEAKFFEEDQKNVTSFFLSQEQRELLHSNPELFFWDKCLYKVYPFVNNEDHHRCECRVLVLNWNQTISTAYERKTYFNLSQSIILSNMLMHWSQLEKFRTTGKEYTSSLDATKITKSMFVAKHMKAFEWKYTGITCIQRGISAWEELEYFKLQNVRIEYEIPNDFNALKSMKYLSFENNGLRSFPDSICNMTNLEVLDIKLELIPLIPRCISQLTKLKQLTVENCISLEHVPISVFTLPNLVILSLFHAKISSQSLIQYNLPNYIDENNTEHALEWLQNELFVSADEFYLQLNPICNESVSWFASETCDYPCSGDDIHAQFCSPRLLGDGKCDELCDNGLCTSDHGDCVQLCFNPFSECTYELYTNDVCDPQCNHKYCVDYTDNRFTEARKIYDEQLVNYAADNYHCVHSRSNTSIASHEVNTNLNCSNSNSTFFDLNITKYSEDDSFMQSFPKQCNSDWIGDGICDDLCRTDECLNDAGDCGPGCNNKAGYLNVCGYIYDAWKHFVGHQTYYINISYFCDSIYPKSVALFGEDGSEALWGDKSCSAANRSYDFNNDNCVNFREWTYTAYVFGGGWILKGKQVNCSECIGMEYYNIDCNQKDSAAATTTQNPMIMDTCEISNE